MCVWGGGGWGWEWECVCAGRGREGECERGVGSGGRRGGSVWGCGWGVMWEWGLGEVERGNTEDAKDKQPLSVDFPLPPTHPPNVAATQR